MVGSVLYLYLVQRRFFKLSKRYLSNVFLVYLLLNDLQVHHMLVFDFQLLIMDQYSCHAVFELCNNLYFSLMIATTFTGGWYETASNYVYLIM